MKNSNKRLPDFLELLQRGIDILREEEITQAEDGFPWEEHIAEFSEELDEFAKKKEKKKKPISKAKLRELDNLHGALIRAKKKLSDFEKNPPTLKKDLDAEISSIQNAMVDVLKSTGMTRIEAGRYIYSLRKTPTYYRVVSEKTAIMSLRKKKLGRYIKVVETLDMAKLKGFLKRRGITIPGLKKMTGDVSIYIYERHEEDEPELIYIVGPEELEDFEEGDFEEGDFEEGDFEKNDFEELEENEESSSSSGEEEEESSSSSSESSDEDEYDEGLEWHLIPENQRLDDIRETIEDREPRKSDPFPDKVVGFIKESYNKHGKTVEEIDKKLCELIKKGEMPTWKMYLSDAEKYSSTESFFYEVPYEPSEQTDEQLGDDFRLVCAHYSTWKETEGEGIKFTKEQILENAEKIIKEIKERVKDEKMNYTFSPEKMKESSKELYGLVREELPEGLKEIGEVKEEE